MKFTKFGPTEVFHSFDEWANYVRIGWEIVSGEKTFVRRVHFDFLRMPMDYKFEDLLDHLASLLNYILLVFRKPLQNLLNILTNEARNTSSRTTKILSPKKSFRIQNRIETLTEARYATNVSFEYCNHSTKTLFKYKTNAYKQH